jgi:hypothetical protein
MESMDYKFLSGVQQEGSLGFTPLTMIALATADLRARRLTRPTD